MSKAITFVIACGLAATGITYGLLTISNSHQRQPAPRQGRAMLGDNEIGTMVAAASGAWRAAVAPSGSAERAPATQVVLVPAVKVPSIPYEANATPVDRGSLVQVLQRELARVGCYDGEINGVWTTSTRQAMKTFLDRVNATLPIHQPDGVLLALVQGQRAKTCGTSCPAGQDLANDGRCLPTAILHREAKKDSKKAILAATGWSTTTTVAPTLPSSPFEGQMALAGQKAEINAVAPKAEPAQPAHSRSPVAHYNLGGDWRAELWKRQGH